jgi:hypothetical protein
MTGPATAIVARWQQALKDLDMGPDGLFRVELHCLKCGKLLNADGNHPAEVHAGTSNGLCYGCTKAGPYITRVYLLDGARQLSWPPSCPSYRRDRETFYGYAGCEVCKGLGIGGIRSSMGGGTYRTKCDPCWNRFYGQPARKTDTEWGRKIMESGQRAFESELRIYLMLPKRCSHKRYIAALMAMDPEVREVIRQDIQRRVISMRVLNARRTIRNQAWDWREPTAEEIAA